MEHYRQHFRNLHRQVVHYGGSINRMNAIATTKVSVKHLVFFHSVAAMYSNNVVVLDGSKFVKNWVTWWQWGTRQF